MVGSSGVIGVWLLGGPSSARTMAAGGPLLLAESQKRDSLSRGIISM